MKPAHEITVLTGLRHIMYKESLAACMPVHECNTKQPDYGALSG
jgi:hypothetical protein